MVEMKVYGVRLTFTSDHQTQQEWDTVKWDTMMEEQQTAEDEADAALMAEIHAQ